MAGRLVLAGALVWATSAASAAEPAPAVPGETQARPYVSGFCGPVALGDPDPAAFGQLLSAWQARGVAGGGDEDTLQDATVTGQAFAFADKDAPRAVVDRRQGVCSLIYRSVAAPTVLTAELKSVQLPVGQGNALEPWRRMVIRRAGPPGPIRYAVKLGDSGSVALCATIYEDLRLRDNSPATLVKVATCRLSGDETFDNG